MKPIVFFCSTSNQNSNLRVPNHYVLKL